MRRFLPLVFAVSVSAHAAQMLPIIKIGHPTLRLTALELTLTELKDEKFQNLIDDMIHTMTKSNGVGLAAPQVDRSIRLFVMKSWPSVKLTVVINPKIEYLDEFGEKDSVEGCLSIPGKNLKVRRHKRIHLSYFDRYGEFVSEEVKGFKAIIAQHEYDHLNGVLIVDLANELNSWFSFDDYATAPLM